MAQKVIAVTLRAALGDATFNENELPAIKAALEEGYTVKQVVPIPAHNSTESYSVVALVVLEN